MDLRSFIKETLVQIVGGIEDAADALKDSSATINPRNVLGTYGTSDARIYGYLGLAGQDQPKQAVHLIDFDVAVTAASGTETRGGIGVVMGVLAMGSQGKSDESNASVSRIKFAVPVVLPAKK